jgi:glutathione S-transferase
MLRVLTADTPNGIKIPIALEELGVPYELVRIDLAEKHGQLLTGTEYSVADIANFGWLRVASYAGVNAVSSSPAVRPSSLSLSANGHRNSATG